MESDFESVNRGGARGSEGGRWSAGGWWGYRWWVLVVVGEGEAAVGGGGVALDEFAVEWGCFVGVLGCFLVEFGGSPEEEGGVFR